MCDHDKQGKHIDGEECQCRIERVPNFAQPRLLLALAKKPAHGYELIELLGQEGGAAPDPGNFYRILRGLEEEGCVCSTWDTQNAGPARRVYELTDQGMEFLYTWAVTIRSIHELLDHFLSDYETLFPKSKKRS
jgi:PadR family transcriptional regulator, regulatory protein PadR